MREIDLIKNTDFLTQGYIVYTTILKVDVIKRMRKNMKIMVEEELECAING